MAVELMIERELEKRVLLHPFLWAGVQTALMRVSAVGHCRK